MRPNIGQLDTKVKFEKKAFNQDSTYGTEVETWVPIAEIWANRRDQMPGSDDAIAAGAIESTKLRSRLRFRWRSDIDSTCRVVILHPLRRTMEIIGGPAEIGDRKSFMEILCEEVSTNG